jgi:hypothetical protein
MCNTAYSPLQDIPNDNEHFESPGTHLQRNNRTKLLHYAFLKHTEHKTNA